MPDQQTAREIFLAIEKRFNPEADIKRFPAVDVNDAGAAWEVFRWRPPEKLPDGQFRVTHGGGQLSMAIAKCDAAISKVFFTR